jgi:hypothetical protein
LALAWFSRIFPALLLAFTLSALPLSARATTCELASEMDVTTRSALEQAANRYLQMAQTGDVAGLRGGAIPSLAGNFGGIESAVVQHQNALKAGKPNQPSMYLLEAEGTTPLPRAEFYCGIFNSPDRVSFVIPNLPPGRYGVVAFALEGASPLYFTTVLNEQASAWKLAGLSINLKEIGGHDSAYFASKAAQFAASNQGLLAWLYYMEAWELNAPVNFMYTVDRDKLADQMQKSKPADFPTAKSPMQLLAGGKTFAVTDVFPEPVPLQGTASLYLIMKYQATTDVSDTGKTFQANMDAIHAMVQRFPDLRTAFEGIVARAVAPSGADYGTMLSMKDLGK